MAIPTSRQSFKDYCLRKLGAPVMEINVDDDQVEDRIDEALLYFSDYHFDGSDKTYYKHQITSDDIANRYVTMADNIIGVVNIFPLGQSIEASNIFSLRYQIALNDVYTLNNVSVVPYYMALTSIQFLEQILVGKQPLRYNRHVNRVYIDTDWNVMSPGDYLVFEAYQVVDPDVFTKTWGDRWLARYAVCLIKMQWGSNLKKYQGMKLPGGMIFNGQAEYIMKLLKKKQTLKKK